jgi:hypothetical protein
MRLTVDEEIRGESGRIRMPRQARVRGGVDSGQHVVRMRTLTRAPQGASGKTGSDVEHVVETPDGHHFGFGRSMDVDKLH